MVYNDDHFAFLQKFKMTIDFKKFLGDNYKAIITAFGEMKGRRRVLKVIQYRNGCVRFPDKFMLNLDY